MRGEERTLVSHGIRQGNASTQAGVDCATVAQLACWLFGCRKPMLERESESMIRQTDGLLQMEASGHSSPSQGCFTRLARPFSS